jgi:hypothetical protein
MIEADVRRQREQNIVVGADKLPASLLGLVGDSQSQAEVIRTFSSGSQILD